MVMPHRSERRPEQQHEECYRDQDTQGSLWVRHFEAQFRDCGYSTDKCSPESLILGHLALVPGYWPVDRPVSPKGSQLASSSSRYGRHLRFQRSTERFHQEIHGGERKSFVVDVRVKLHQPDGGA